MITALIFMLCGAGLVGLVWAIVYNHREHPGKIEEQIRRAYAKAKELEQQAEQKLRR